jgi:hypothetical protein
MLDDGEQAGKRLLPIIRCTCSETTGTRYEGNLDMTIDEGGTY